MNPVSTQTIDVPVQDLFQKFDQDHNAELSRTQLRDLLNNVFSKLNVDKQVSQQDVNNFLLDYDITHANMLTRNDFQGIQKLRFTLNKIIINEQIIAPFRPSILQKPIPQRPTPISSQKIIQRPLPQAHYQSTIKQQPALVYIDEQVFVPLPEGKVKMLIKKNNQIQEVNTIMIPTRMMFDIFNKQRNGILTRTQIKDVLILIFQNFGLNQNPNDNDVNNFLKDFDINHDNELTIKDFHNFNTICFKYSTSHKI